MSGYILRRRYERESEIYDQKALIADDADQNLNPSMFDRAPPNCWICSLFRPPPPWRGGGSSPAAPPSSSPPPLAGLTRALSFFYPSSSPGGGGVEEMYWRDAVIVIVTWGLSSPNEIHLRWKPLTGRGYSPPVLPSWAASSETGHVTSPKDAPEVGWE